METEKKEKEITDLKGRYDLTTKILLMLVHGYSRLPGVPIVVHPSTFQPFISCANIPFINGITPNTLTYNRCLPDIDDPECPQCAKENATIRDLRHQQDDWSERQDLFRAHLRDSDDKFGVVANWFGKGVMNSIKLVDT